MEKNETRTNAQEIFDEERMKVIEIRMNVIESVACYTQEFLNTYNQDLKDHYTREDELRARVKALETSLMALQVGVGDGSKHKNDGGWFD